MVSNVVEIAVALLRCERRSGLLRSLLETLRPTSAASRQSATKLAEAWYIRGSKKKDETRTQFNWAAILGEQGAPQGQRQTIKAVWDTPKGGQAEAQTGWSAELSQRHSRTIRGFRSPERTL